MPISQVFDKLKAKRLLKPLDPRPIPNLLPLRFVVNKRCAYHQGPGHDTNNCFVLHHAIQNLIDNKVIVPPIRPSITNNPLPNHNFGRGSRIHDTKAVPSSLYQKVWFPYEGAILTIYGATLTMLKSIFGNDSEKEPLTLDGFEIEKPSFERREEEVEKISIDFAPYSNNNVKNELPSKDELVEDCEEAYCSSPDDSHCHTTFWARL